MNKVMEHTTGDFITFQGWSEFNKKVRNLDAKDFISEETLCLSLGLDFIQYTSIVEKSIRYWKDSPSSSLLHTLGMNGLDLPEDGDVIFDTHLMQTRFLVTLDKFRLVSERFLGKIKDEQGFLTIRGKHALTYPAKDSVKYEFVVRKSNEVIQMIYTYFLYCRSREEKGITMPSKIYRGIRYRDIWRMPVIQQRVPKIEDSLTHLERRKVIIDTIQAYLLEEGLNGLCETNLVSFSSNKSVAKYFTDNEGIIVEILSKDVEIMTSEIHDERWNQPDFVSNKKEREYIIRVADTKVQVNRVYINDLDYLVAINNPLAVNLFSHDNLEATYELKGVNIKAKYVWSSNTTGSVRYRNMNADGWSKGSREFAREYGFSPIISNQNVEDIKNFRIDSIR